MNTSENKKLAWLGTNLFMVLSMVIIGGITRLTDSGLSMTTWNLIKGVIPPLNQEEWINVFNLYKNYPEYNLKNFSMTLEEFKKIFFWEYIHRIWGRLIGFTFFIPLFYFWLKGYFNKNEKKLILLITLLGFFQAFMGWYMVESGLIDQPDVSHFRLSVHLITAFIIYSLLLYYFWNIHLGKKKVVYRINTNKTNLHKKNFFISLLLLLTTVLAGALVSGTEAGLSYNNFPFMGDGFLPPILISGEPTNLKSLFNDQGFLQFLHRLVATITLLYLLHTIFKANKDRFFNNFRQLFYFLFFMIVFQYTLGVIILILYVPILLGLMHQIGALLILSLLVISLCEAKKMGLKIAPSKTL